jgi:peptidyl-prolyl cis-trans isomerase A (cyclophilin A)
MRRSPRLSLLRIAVLTALSASCAANEPSFAPPPASPAPAAAPAAPAAPPAAPRPTPPEAPAPVPTRAAPTTAPVDPRLLPEGDGLPPPAPARYTVRLDTTKGPVLIDVTRAWAPHGADRFHDLVRRGAYDDNAFFRAVAGFMVQVGIPGDPRVSAAWRTKHIPDDPPVEHNVRGTVTFATSGPDRRVNQFFVNLVDNTRLDAMGFAPLGRVRDMAAIDALYTGYGEGAPQGRGPSQARIQLEGNAYLRAEFPELDYLRTARIEP